MKKTKNKPVYYKDLNIIRVVACIAVLFYHLGILKGGYLAVCIFFVLSGYLSVISASKKESFSFKEYYLNRLTKLYLPLFLVVFITIGIVSFFKDIYWLSIKSETLSVLLGYNNFWQISANLDYFARHVDSPFMHFWYIGILFQFELVFPFLYKGLKYLEKKIHKHASFIISMIITLGSILFFIYASLGSNLMVAYYNTFARLFSLTLGMSLGFLDSYKVRLVPQKFKKKAQFIFYGYLLISCLSFIFIKSTSSLFAISMILVSLITTRLIVYAKINKEKENKIDKIIKSISNLTYEIYLFQYPVIYLFQYININHYLKILVIIMLVVGGAYILNMATKRKVKMKKMPMAVLTILVGFSCFGVYKFVTTKNFEKEMKELEIELAENEKKMLEKQKEYTLNQKQEEEDWTKELEKLENEENYGEMIKDMQITFVGDSVMLGAMTKIEEMFPNAYFDAKESRSTKVGVDIVNELKENGKLGEVVVLHLGTNGDCGNSCKEELMDKLADREVFWITTTYKNNYEAVNRNLQTLVEKYDNAHLIDWYTLSKDHEDWFYKDGIHLPPIGRTEYTKMIYNALLEVYQNVFKEKREELINNHKEELKNKVTFYGNDILFYDFAYLQTSYENERFEVQKDFSYKALKEKIEEEVNKGTLSKTIVLAFDNSSIISTSEYQDLISLCKDSHIYLVSTNKPLDSLGNYENVTIINFYSVLKKNKEYLNVDGIHLTEKGNEALNNLLNKYLKEVVSSK